MKLELKHLCSYLPYGLKYFIDFEDGDTIISTVDGIIENEIYLSSGNETLIEDKMSNPILRPLSDLVDSEEIEVDGKEFVAIDYFIGGDSDEILNACKINDLRFLPYNIIEKLLEWHFDIFGLIDAGLAIDYNRIKK